MSCSSRRPIGTWNGSCSNRASITATTSGSTTAWSMSRPRAPASLCRSPYQEKLVRFIENHDEPRAAATFAPGVHEAEAIITFLSTGLRFFHQGQFEGRRKRISPHLVRAPKESTDDTLHRFYDRLFAVLRQRVVRDGQWRLLDSVPAWDGNGTWDSFRIFAWQGPGKERLLVTVNYAATQSQCYVRLPFPTWPAIRCDSKDQTGDACYEHDGDELLSRGLYLDVPAWGYHVFELA